MKVKFDSSKLSHLFLGWLLSGMALIATPFWGSFILGFIYGVWQPFTFLDWSNSCSLRDAGFCSNLDSFANIGVFTSSCLVVLIAILIAYILLRIVFNFLNKVVRYVNSRV